MNNLAATLVGVLLGAGIGVAGGCLLGGGGESQPVPVTGQAQTLPKDESPENSSQESEELDGLKVDLADSRSNAEDLARERDALAGERDQLSARLAKLLDGPMPAATDPMGEPDTTNELATEQIEARRIEIKSRLDAAWETKNGRAVLDALHEMEALGPGVYADLMQEWIRVDEDHSASNELGIDKYTWRREWGGSTELLRASIDDPGSPVRFRYSAVHMLPEREAPQPTAEYLRDKLLNERDEHAIMQMAETLGELGDPAAIDALITVVRRHFERFYAKSTVVTALGQFDDTRTISELRLIAGAEAEHEAVRAAAESALLRVAPPVTGLLITRVSPGTKGASAGLKTGDILTKLNSQPITSKDAIHFGSGELKFEVFSEGVFKDVTVEPGALGIEYDFVKAKPR